MKHWITALLILFTIINSTANAQLNAFKFNDPIVQKIDSLRNLYKGIYFFKKNSPQNVMLAKAGLMARATSTDPCGTFCSRILPVTGLVLEGKRINNNEVQLKWKTYSELNNRGFDIERSFTPDNHFEYDGFVTGVGNSDVESKYKLTDNNDNENTTFYRLKQTDLDGNFVYSNIIEVKGYVIPPTLKIFPNPGNNSTVIFSISGVEKEQKASLRIVDAMGRNMYLQSNFILADKEISLKQLVFLQPGYYNIVITSESNNLRSAFVVTQ